MTGGVGATTETEEDAKGGKKEERAYDNKRLEVSDLNGDEA